MLLLPAEAYGYNRLSHFRVGYGRKNMAEGLEQLDQYIVEKWAG